MFGLRKSLRQQVILTLPTLPGELEGVRLAHLSDLHIARRRRRHRWLLEEIAHLHADVALLTGDYMDHPGDEPVAREVMRELTEELARHVPRGIFGVCGNHDTPDLRQRLRDLPVRWLEDDVVRLPGWPLEIAGLTADRVTQPEILTLLERQRALTRSLPTAPPALRLLLAHYPYYLPTAADLGFHLVFSGHTHGGQVRLPSKRALYNSCDLPLHLTSGVLRLRQTLNVVSRGLGESGFPVRLFCPPHLPVYELRRGPLPGTDSWHVQNVQPW